MDASIRSLLASAEKHTGFEKNPTLQQAYILLRNVAETRPAVDAPEPFGVDLYVQCAEIAFRKGQVDMAKECLKMFFMKPPPHNQFLCRAYLCEAQLLAPPNADSPEQLEKAVVYLLKAISFAKETPNYHFLVYNASVLYWQFCRPFLKPLYRQYLARSLHQVVKALDDIDDQDYEWRAQLMIALIECHLDAGRVSDASHITAAAASFIKQYVPSLYKQVFGLMVRHQLVDPVKFNKEVKASPELSIYYKICKLKVSAEKCENKVFYSEIQSILNQMEVPHTPGSVQARPVSRQETKLTTHSRSPASSPTGGKEKDDDSAPTVPSEKRKSPSKGGRRTPTPTTSRKLPVDCTDKPYLLLELARFCLELDFADLAESCIENTKTCNIKEPSFYLELEFLHCELMVKSLGDRQESYQKCVVEVRLQAIKRCEEAIMNAIRSGNPNVIQAGCVTQWNLCLPLLQANLRHHVRKPLILVAEALADTQSLLVELRCQVHTELTKCEEDREQIQVAMDHLKKALELDDGNVYRERLEVALHRLQLRSQLYSQPDSPEDQAAMIIEQARTADSGTIRMKRSLLVKAGEALAPDAFLLVLDSESDTKDVVSGKGPLTVIRRLCGRARRFTQAIRKAEGHLKRLGDENERERARLWADLAKTARKQEVWDVCRVASRFCLLYDDGRWKSPSASPSRNSPKLERMKTGEGKEKEDEEKKTGRATVSQGPSIDMVAAPLYDKDLIRILAEVNFIQGEALVHLLRTEGVQLNDQPIPPEDKSKHPKGYVAKKPQDDPDWIEYCDWISYLSETSTSSFLRGLSLGMELSEAWLVCSAAAYIWNYNNHLLTQNRHRELIDTLQVILDGVKKVGHAGETVMLVNICNALAFGLLKPWIPPKEEPGLAVVSASPSPRDNKSPRGRGKSVAAASKPKQAVTISPDAMPDLKKAIEVCEYVMRVTCGYNPQDVVPIAVRILVLQTWVLAKQMAQQQISKSCSPEDEGSTKTQRQMTKAIIATEMLCLSKNDIMEFKDMLTISEITKIMEECEWPDQFVELQLWVRLTYMAYLAHTHDLVMHCSHKALRFAASGTLPKGKKHKACSHSYMVEQEMLSYASVLQGQSLIDNMGGKNAVRREAMEAFLYSAMYARNANNYELVMTSARHYWNACITLVGQPLERELLKEPIRTILDCIATTAEKKTKKEDKDATPVLPDAKSDSSVVATESKTETKDAKTVKEQKTSGMIGSPQEDLTLRAALYGVLFMSYTDQGEWESALQAMDQAVDTMPRTKHRLLIFKHRVMVKAKLGHPVHMDIQKFKEEMKYFRDESEDYVAHMWRRVALSSREPLEQMSSYQLAIEALNSPSNEWQKVEYLVEFGQWLYVNDFPLQDAMDQVEWAADILLNMTAQASQSAAPVETKAKGGSVLADAKRVPAKAATRPAKAKGGSVLADAKRVPAKAATRPAKAKGGSVLADAKRVPAKAATRPAKGRRTPPKKGGSMKGSMQSLTGHKTVSLGDKPAEAKSMKSTSSDSEMEINPADYIPIVKEADIGVLPADTSLTMSGVKDVRQLDMLIRVHVVLAQIVGSAAQCYNDVCLTAYGYVLQLWKVCLSSSGPVIKELAMNQPDSLPSGKKSSQPKDKKAKEPAKDKPKRKGALDTMPVTTDDWAHYDAPDELLEAFKQEAMKKTGINSETIDKPMLSLHTLDTLMTMLTQIGYTHLSLPILAFEDVLSRDLLKCNALHVLVHIRAIEVCQQLDLKSGYHYHEKLIGGQLQINEDERAMSREEIAILKEKKVQVMREEMRLKESLARIAEKTTGKDRRTLRTRTSHLDKKEEDELDSHLGQVLGAVTFRAVWTDTAEVLLRLGHYQNARDLLAEANIAAQEFDDRPLQGRILYLLAKLSFQEAQFIQAVNLCKAAQEMYEGDEQYWFNTTQLMIEATLEDYENRYASRLGNAQRKRYITARTVVVHALNEFLAVHEVRPNRLSMTGYILGMLEGKLASIQAAVLMKKNINAPQIMKGVLSACERFENATDRLIKLGYKRETVPLMKEYAGILRHLARKSIENEIKHTYYLQSLMVLREGLSLAEDVFQDVQTLCPLSNNRGLSFPTQREFADILIETGDLLLEILQLHDKERRIRQLANQRKGSIVKMVEDFICQTPVYTHMEKEWVEIAHTCGEEALSKLLTAHSLAGNIHRLKARALCSLGWCFKLLSLQKGPDAPPHWLVQEMELLKMNSEAESVEAEEADEKSEPPDKEEKAFRKYSPLIKQMKDMHQDSKYYLIQATECLVQCLNLSLHHKYSDLAGRVALELVDCFGQFDPATASSFLALAQSCDASRRLEAILHTSQPDPTASKLAALLRQRYHLQRNDVNNNLATSPLMASIHETLHADWQCWKRLEVMPTHVDLLKEFPPNFNFVILQHSADKNFLYGSLLDRPRPGGDKAGDKRSQKQASTATSRAKVFGMESSARLLDELVSKFQQHKQSVQQLLLKQEYQRTQAALRQKMLQNLDDGMKQQETKSFVEDEDRDEENRLQEEFRDLVAAMESYLRPIMEPIESSLSSPPPVVSKDQSPPQECVILLADSDLMQMPLEALRCLGIESIAAISRDFSLQLFYHRYHVELPPEDPAGDKKKKPKGGDQSATSRIPGSREAKQKQAKIIPVDRPLKPGQFSLNTMNVKYVLDTNLDCAETEVNKPIEEFQKILEDHEQQFTPRWLGISGEDHTPSVGEWEVYMTESSGFVFYGMEHLLSYIPPSKVSALNIPDCTMLYLLDLAQTSKSFLRQSKIDVLKSHSDLALEKPLETAMLTSLTGVKCVMMNQWYCTLAENKDRLHLTMKDLLEKGKMSGETVRLLCSPQRRRAEEAASIAAEEEASQNKTSVDSESHKGDRKRGNSPDSPRSPRKNGKKDPTGKKGRSVGGSDSSRGSSPASSRPGGRDRGGGAHGGGSEVDPDKDQEEPKDAEKMLIQRSWFNMVCYGLPSVVVTQ